MLCSTPRWPVWLQHNYICRSVSTGLQTLETLSWNAIQVLQKVTCTVQQLGTHENQSMAYRRYVRDFAVLSSVVRGSMLASVRLLLLRLNERKHQHDYNQLLKHINVLYVQQNCFLYCCVIYFIANTSGVQTRDVEPTRICVQVANFWVWPNYIHCHKYTQQCCPRCLQTWQYDLSTTYSQLICQQHEQCPLLATKHLQ